MMQMDSRTWWWLPHVLKWFNFREQQDVHLVQTVVFKAAVETEFVHAFLVTVINATKNQN